MNLGFLGAGTITSAIVTGLHSEIDQRYSIRLSPRNSVVAAELAGRFPSVSVASSNQNVLDESEIVVIAVRPQVAREVLSGVQFRAGHDVVSLVSGFSVQQLAGLVAPAARITRAVPLPLAAKRRSPTAIFPRNPAAIELFASLGEAFGVESELEFDALCTVTATMAAYFQFADGIASWLTRHGISQGQSRDYVARILSGLSHTAMEAPGLSFQSLRVDHATRGGTNEQLVNHLIENHVFETLSAGLDGILRRVTAGYGTTP